MEGSFVNAIFSSGVAYSISKACSSNKLESCSCQRATNHHHQQQQQGGDPTGTTHNGFQWHQCNDNVAFGLSFAKKFIDSVELNWSAERVSSTPAQVMMNLHNNKVGRTVRSIRSLRIFIPKK